MSTGTEARTLAVTVNDASRDLLASSIAQCGRTQTGYQAIIKNDQNLKATEETSLTDATVDISRQQFIKKKIYGMNVRHRLALAWDGCFTSQTLE